jgi:hypothetical protein
MRESSLLVDVVARSAVLGPGFIGMCFATSVGHFDGSYTAKGCTPDYLRLIE